MTVVYMHKFKKDCALPSRTDKRTAERIFMLISMITKWFDSIERCKLASNRFGFWIEPHDAYIFSLYQRELCCYMRDDMCPAIIAFMLVDWKLIHTRNYTTIHGAWCMQNPGIYTGGQSPETTIEGEHNDG